MTEKLNILKRSGVAVRHFPFLRICLKRISLRRLFINLILYNFFYYFNHRQPRRGVCHQKLTEKQLPLKARIPTNRIAVEILIF